MRAFTGNHNVAGGHQLAPAAQRRPINYRNDGLRDLPQPAKDRMESFEHLKDRCGHVLFNRHPGAEGFCSLRRHKHDGRQISSARALVQRRANLAHHGDIQDVQRRPREGNPRDAILNCEFDILEFVVHRSRGSFTARPVR